MRAIGISSPLPGESHNGDGYVIAVLDKRKDIKQIVFSHNEEGEIEETKVDMDFDDCDTVLTAVIDGVGHGIAASTTTTKVIECIKSSFRLELNLLVKECHNSILYSRGVALGIALIDINKSQIHYVGVGNVIMQVVTLRRGNNGNKVKRKLIEVDNNKAVVQKFIPNNGIVGYNLPKRLISTKHNYTPGDVIAMYSDGIDERNSAGISGFAGLNPKSIAQAVMRDYRKDYDDATVVIVK